MQISHVCGDGYRFGVDKPDMRFGLELCDVTDILSQCAAEPFAAVSLEGDTIIAMNAKGLGCLSRKELDGLCQEARKATALGIQTLMGFRFDELWPHIVMA